ncbi:chaplin [Kitasatospora acidiphila]|uniref:Chaplin n=1 Tax=Kitasatospora acidiphila TaxID=2567942 RepID=A0A540WAY3_9ACTN|nr:chaplin [Kitasatospora acidiphila]TQF06195.1 chaplin [Kitasatospora acidiphila]
MRQVAKKGILTAVATGTVLASAGGYAYAAAGASGAAAGSPGVASGNSVQVPIEVPINVCGDTIDVVGALNPAFGNQCANTSSSGHHHGGDQNGPGGHGSTGGSVAGSSASGVAKGSPGVGSGNNAQVPVDVPVNACGDSVDVIGALNPAFGNECANTSVSQGVHTPPPAPTPQQCTGGCDTPPPAPPAANVPPASNVPPGTSVSDTHGTPIARSAAPGTTQVSAESAPAATKLAYTGVSGLDVLAPAGLGLLLAGGVLYRKGRRAS